MSLLVSREVFVAKFVTRTVTFGRTAPEGSVAVPNSVAVVSCARQGIAIAKIVTKIRVRDIVLHCSATDRAQQAPPPSSTGAYWLAARTRPLES